MAMKQTKQQTPADEQGQEPQDAAQEAPQDLAPDPGPGNPDARPQKVPTAPRPALAADGEFVGRIRGAVERVRFSRSPEELRAAVEHVEGLPLHQKRLSPAVLAYRAEAADWMRGRIERLEAQGQA